MFEKLKRAKSFIHRSRHEEERELDLSEYSHLRRNVAISSELLEQQKLFTISKEHTNETKKRYSSGQIDKSQKQLNDKVLKEFHPKVSLGNGDGRSNSPFDRRNQAYLSERTHLSRHYLKKKDQDLPNKTTSQPQPYSSPQQLKLTNSNIFRSKFDRQSPAYMSERTSRQNQPMRRQMQLNVDRSRRSNSSETNSPRLSDRQYQPPKRLIQLNVERNRTPSIFSGMQRIEANFDRHKRNITPDTNIH